MKYLDFNREIETKKPRYLSKFNTLVEAVSSTRGAASGSDFVQFSSYYHTYMYAFMIGYHLGVCNQLLGGDTKDSAPMSYWKPAEIVDYVLMLIFSEPYEKLGFNWIDIETMTIDEAKQAIATVIKRIEGYANTGFEFIQDRYNNHKEDFSDPYIFVNLLKEVTKE
jgi:hypothetical protein